MHSCAVRLSSTYGGAVAKSKRAVLRPHVERLRSWPPASPRSETTTTGSGPARGGDRRPGRNAIDSLIERIRRYFDEQVDIELLELAVSYLEEP